MKELIIYSNPEVIGGGVIDLNNSIGGDSYGY